MALPTFIVELGLSANTGSYLVLDSPTAGILDTNRLAAGTGLIPTWTDVTPRLLGFGCNRGRQRQIQQFSAGSATIDLLNLDSALSPSNLSGPYVTAGTTQIRPTIPVRIRATWAGTTYDVWYGYVDRWEQIIPSDDEWRLTTRISATDGFKKLGRQTSLATTPVGAGELSGARIARILDYIGWDTFLRQIDAGQTTLQASDLSGVALSQLQLAADSEAGIVYMGAEGSVIFEARYHRITSSRSATSQATFGDGPGELPYLGVQPIFDDDLLINQAQYTRVGGAVQVVNDFGSQAAIGGIVTDTKSNLLNTSDADVGGIAGWVVARFANPEERIDSISIIPPGASSATLTPQALGRKISDRITVKQRSAHGDLISQDVFIEAISHSYDAMAGSYSTGFSLSSASAWLPFLILDSPTQGLLDVNRLAF